MDPLLLARAQFAANMSFHILFPTITIALGWILLFMRLRWLKTGDDAWLAAYRSWTKVFALSYALGVVSGVTMSFQFGTNWPGYMERIGNISGPLLGYEVLTAFFLEAGFLAIMLPVAYRIDAGGAFHATSWLGVVFNPSFPYRFAHMMLASTLTVAFLLAGIAAWQVLRGSAGRATTKVMRTGLVIAAIAAYTVYSYCVLRGKTGELEYA